MTGVGGGLQCPLCGDERAKLRFVEKPHRVQDCVGCGVTYVSPRRDAQSLLEDVYDENYWRSGSPRERGYADYAGDAVLHERTYERRWRALRHRLPYSGRALDIGCAEGSFLRFLQGQGWEVRGIEPSRVMAELASQRLESGAVQQASLDSACFGSTKFDLITMWDVLEHLPAPIEGLRTARDLLVPEGKLVIETQDISSAMARVCGHRWQHFKHDEHLLHFTPQTLEAACRAAGLKLTHVQRRAAGKYVRGSFLVERSARIHAKLPSLLRPVLGGDWSIYVNPMDEIIAIAEPS